MSYQVLARKYRPQSFEEMLGQEPVVQTLKNAITHNRLHHAYLFCGPRGTGKTSLARIFAKSINCEKGPTVAPCQKCAACESITKGNAMDVIEIDGASNTGVDDVRELREQVKFMPTSGKYKIYIVDEVHMLSTSAFNALLKTLEEPPAHVKFFFATTESHKIPITILSRCQRFDLKRMRTPQLVGHLEKILSEEKISVPKDALTLISQCAEGSVRDSLSLLDQIISYCGDKATLENITDVLGLADRLTAFEMLQHLLKKEVTEAIELSNKLYEKGTDIKILAQDLLSRVHQLILWIAAKEVSNDLSPAETDRLQNLASLTNEGRLIVMFQVLAKGIEDISRTDFPKMVFEVLLMKLIKTDDWLFLPSAAPSQTASPQTAATASAPTPVMRPQAPSAPVKGDSASWLTFVKKILETKPQIGSILEHAAQLSFIGDCVVLGIENKSIYADMLKERLPAITEEAKKFFGRPITFDIKSLEQSQPTPRDVREAADKKQTEAIRNQALANPAVKLAEQMLGAKVKEVKPL